MIHAHQWPLANNLHYARPRPGELDPSPDNAMRGHSLCEHMRAPVKSYPVFGACLRLHRPPGPSDFLTDLARLQQQGPAESARPRRPGSVRAETEGGDPQQYREAVA